MKLSRLSCFVILFLLFNPLSSYSATPDKIDQKREELQSIYNKLEKKKTRLKQTKIKQQNVLQQISLLNRKIKKNNERLNYAKYLVQQRSDELKKINRTLRDAEYRLASLYDDFYIRLREIYKSANLNWMEMFLTIDSFSELINQAICFEKIIKQDIILLNKIKEQKKIIQKNKKLVQEKKKEIENYTASVVDAKENLEQNKQEKQKLKKLLEIKRRRYEKEIAELKKNSEEIEALIRKLLNQSTDVKGTGVFLWPVKGWISSTFGQRRHPIFKTVKFHTGIDIAAPRGRSIKASDRGVVIYSGKWGGYGKTIIINHGNNMSTVYAHQSRLYVKKGQNVGRGQVIGLVGSTGYSTGPHLHFEIRIKGKVRDPLKYLPKK